MTADTLRRLAEARRAPDGPDLVGLAFRPADPAAYGRVILDEEGRIENIVEFADAASAHRQLDLCNAGIVPRTAQRLFPPAARPGHHTAHDKFHPTTPSTLPHTAAPPGP